MGRPRMVLVVSGTGTGVGKTWVAAGLILALRSRDLEVCARKPLQSGDPASDVPDDALLLAAASGEDAFEVCPAHRRFGVALAPPMAARELGLAAPVLVEVVRDISGGWPGHHLDVGLVEGAGGLASPLTCDGDTADLALAIGADAVVIVADPDLGVVHGVRSAIAVMARLGASRPDVVIHLNRFDSLQRTHVLGRQWLLQEEGLVVTADVDELAGVIHSRLAAR